MTAVRVSAAALLVLLALPAAAETPSPAPDDRTTSLTISPVAGPDRSTVVLRGFSDCAVIDGHLVFTTYDGRADNVVVRGTSKTYDYDREKYPFLIRLTVPANAAPGPAKVYAEPFCGPPEEYPSSAVLSFRVERGRLTIRISPRRPDPGDRLRVRASTCDGARGRLTVRVRVRDKVRDVPATVDRTGFASVSVRLGSAAGQGEVSLPRAAAECPGSTPPVPVAFGVRSAPAAVATAATPSPSPSAAGALPSAVQQPSATVSASTSPTAVASPTASTRSRSGAAGLLVAVGLAVAAAAAVAVTLRRRGRRP